MSRLEVFDVNGEVIKEDCLVKIVGDTNNYHAWLRVGNTLRVSHWEDRRSFLGYVIIFLKTKGEGKVCSIGISGDCLEVVKDN